MLFFTPFDETVMDELYISSQIEFKKKLKFASKRNYKKKLILFNHRHISPLINFNKIIFKYNCFLLVTAKI